MNEQQQPLGSSHYPATVMPQQVQQANPAFHATGSLLVPNLLASADGHSPQDFLNSVLPAANKASSMTVAENQLQTGKVQP